MSLKSSFAFVEGTYVENANFHRSDLSNNMWAGGVSETKAAQERRFFTTQAFDVFLQFLLLLEVEPMSSCMIGGSTSPVKAAVCAQSNAFTSVRAWMIPTSLPPIPAGDVWKLLPQLGPLVSIWSVHATFAYWVAVIRCTF